ncbi:MAG: hypothetical protein ACC662_03980 [Planctomycetota bacterium]
MTRRTWQVVAPLAVASLLVAWLALRPGHPAGEGNSRVADDLARQAQRLRDENEGLRRRLQIALSDLAAQAPSGPRLAGPVPPSHREPAAASSPPAAATPSSAPDQVKPIVRPAPCGPGDPRALLVKLAQRGRLQGLLRDIALEEEAKAPIRLAAIAVLMEVAAADGGEVVSTLRGSSAEVDRRVAFQALVSVGNVALLPMIRDALRNPDRPADVPALVQAAARLKGSFWSPAQATGEPDTLAGGDLMTAWAAERGDMGEVWLELDFERAVLPDGIRIHETFNPGAVARVEAKRADGGGYEVLWEGTAPTSRAPRWFEPPLLRATGPTRTIRVLLDTDRIPGWNEIDAVELTGDGVVQWAIAARASSSYGAP